VSLPVALLFPSDDFTSKPELASTLTKVDHGTGHSGVSALVARHGVPLGQSEELRHALRVDDVLCVDEPPHAESLQRLASDRHDDSSIRSTRSCLLPKNFTKNFTVSPPTLLPRVAGGGGR
jgi:hypothetical protein